MQKKLSDNTTAPNLNRAITNEINTQFSNSNSTFLPKELMKKPAKTRAGSPNYKKEDIFALLDIVEEVQPIRNNLWALVSEKLEKWCEINKRPIRDQDSVKTKFDKLCIAKKKTGDPSCPADVCRAKQLARDIQGKVAAMVLEDDKPAISDNVGGATDISTETGKNKAGIGARKNKRPLLSAGISTKKVKTEEIFVDHVESMAGFMGIIAQSMTKEENNLIEKEPEKVIGDAVKIEVDALKTEINQSLQDTKEIINSMSSVLMKLVKKFTNGTSGENGQ